MFRILKVYLFHEVQVLSFFLLRFVTLNIYNTSVAYLYYCYIRSFIVICHFKVAFKYIFTSCSYCCYFPKDRILSSGFNIWQPCWGYETKIVGLKVNLENSSWSYLSLPKTWAFFLTFDFSFNVLFVLSQSFKNI
jgi:hypothetical protein